MALKRLPLFSFDSKSMLPFLLVASFMLAVGVSIGHLRVVPAARAWVESLLFPTGTEPFEGERTMEYAYPSEIFDRVFSDPAVAGKLHYDAIADPAGVKAANDRIYMSRRGFESAYPAIYVLGAEQVVTVAADALPVIKISFSYLGSEYEAFAYGTLPRQCGLTDSVGALVLVGSGLNVSSATYSGAIHPTYGYVVGERTAFPALEQVADNIYVFIKPNEDYLAWHDGKGRKVNINFVAPYHLNLGGSYSVSHLVQSMAFTKWMSACHEQTIVAGLSSGGAAAMLVSLQAEPTVAIVSSGYSTLNHLVKWSSITGLLGVPGFGQLEEPETVRAKLSASPSEWLFTWGTEEVGTYKIEAEEGITANAIGDLPNVTAVVHSGGHVFPVQETREFLLPRVR